MTRLFLQGRTETVRPVTMLSSRFVRAMCDPNIKDTITVSWLCLSIVILHCVVPCCAD